MLETTGNLTLTRPPVAATGMLIRKPVTEVFEAFVNPEITSRFWFSRGSGRLESGARVQWDWEMYGFTVDVDVHEVEPERKIVVEWSSGGEPPTMVEWTFEPLSADTTFVNVTNSGFQGSGDEQCLQACDSTGGFALLLAGAKALLEHGIELNVVLDRFPNGLNEG